ncbi:MAG TPA: EAL domain-containing protein [Noviherbaspirillum sp.]
MPADSPYPAPFDTATFIFPTEWHALSDLLGGTDTAVLYLREGMILHMNAHLADRLGYRAEDLIGQPVESLFPPGNVQALPRHRARQQKTLENSRIRLLAKDGKPVDFRVIANRIDTLNDARCTIWILHPEQDADTGASADAGLLRAVVEHLAGPVMLCDQDMTLAWANKAFQDITGRRGGALSDLVHPEDRSRLHAVLDEAAGTGQDTLLPIAFRLRQGDGFWRQVSGQARNLLSQPDAAGILLCMSDVTAEMQERQNAAAQMKRQLHYLNRLLRMGQRPQPDIDSALKVVLKSSAKALVVARAAYWEIGDDAATTQCLLAYDDRRQNFSTEKPDALFASHFHPLLREIAQDERRMAVDDVDLDPRAALGCEYFHAAGIKAMLIVPVQHDDRMPGLLIMSTDAAPRAWRKDEVEFAANVAGLIAQAFKEIERRRTEAELRHLAHHDSLTGLPNRHFLFDQANDIFPKVTAKTNALAAFFIDLDGFKNVNDSLGHAMGDELLRAAALRLKNVVRKDDILVRLGGDEFMLLARNLNSMRIADDIAAQIVDTMRGTFSLQGRELQISASVGIALYPFDGTDIETLMKKADIAMYHAKAAGRDRYQMFAPRLDNGGTSRSALESELRRALTEGELQHYYQPQVDLRTGKVRCVEALLRWQHPRLGTLLPASFLPVAEETGLIHDISKWVLNNACQQLRVWTAQGLDHLGIAINLSASQLMDRALLAELENVLERSRIPGHRLEWEVTESTVMQHHTMTSSMLDRVADMQIGLSIDDFGTGYSNMAYLRRYPVRKVKIDSSFVHGLPGEGDDRAITDAIISMAQPLGLDVVAEGVETPQQMDYLRERGCDIAQGFFFTQPLTAEQFEKWLIRH